MFPKVPKYLLPWSKLILIKINQDPLIVLTKWDLEVCEIFHKYSMTEHTTEK